MARDLQERTVGTKKEWIVSVDSEKYANVNEVEDTGVKPENWGTQYRLIVDYPDECINEINKALVDLLR